MASRMSSIPRLCLVLGLIAVSGGAPAQMNAASRPKVVATYLSEADVKPSLVLPPPPARGSDLEQQQMSEVRTIGLGASAERLAQAKWDNDREDPSLFDATIGAGFDVKKMPATWELLSIVQHESDAAADSSKRYFSRLRPWGVDPKQPRRCEDPSKGTPLRGYPSGHAALGYAVGMIYAQLIPSKAGAILDRAREYSLSRVICGEHFVSDTEASHVIAAVVATKLMADPRFQQKYARARAELIAAHVADAS
jgi:acid phosphatase (class A)